MGLRIVKASDPLTVEQIVITLYGFPGIGKTSLAFTANDALLLDFDSGAYRAANRGDCVSVKTWGDVAGIGTDDFSGYKTIIVDTAGRALDLLAADIMHRDPKMGRGGALSLQGFGRLRAEFTAWLKLVRGFGCDVVLLAHADEQKSGDETIERIDAQGGSKNEIYKCSDAMGRLTIRNGKRFLLFSPTDTAFGKNPAALEALAVPTFDGGSRFLGEVIAQIKATLNHLSAEQQEISDLLVTWRDGVTLATTPAAMNELVASLPKLDPRIRDNAKRLLWDYAKEHDFAYDKKTGFTMVEAKATA